MTNVRGNAIGLLLGVAAILVHAVTALRYGYYRDELYFIACAQHLAWGYVDQPPLVALAARLAAPFGYALLALRALPVLAAGGAVFFACAIARELGGARFAQWFAGLAAALLPASLFLGSTLTTTSFEPLTWTLSMYPLVRLVRGADARIWYALAGTVAFALYAKYSILLLVVALAIGLLATTQRRVLSSRHLIVAAAAVVLIIAPNFAWQAINGWPMLEVLRNDVTGRQAFNSGLVFHAADLARNAYLFALEQFFFTNPLLVPVWLAGLIALLFSERLRSVRFLGIATVALVAGAMLLAAKSYYIAGIYPMLCAAGACIFESIRPSALRAGVSAICIAGGLALAPLVTPILSVSPLIAYEQLLRIEETRGNPPRLVQPLFAEEFGWDELTAHVAEVYQGLPPKVRSRTAIFADTYADAGAIDFYGRKYGLPRAISGQNSYYLWGTHGYDGSSVIAIGASQAGLLRASFRSVRLVTTYLHPFRWSAEGPTPIFLCSDPIAPLDGLWPRFKWYGA